MDTTTSTAARAAASYVTLTANGDRVAANAAWDHGYLLVGEARMDSLIAAARAAH